MELKVKVVLKKNKAGMNVLHVECRCDLLTTVVPKGTDPESMIPEAISRFLHFFDLNSEAVFVQEDLGFKYKQWTYKIKTERYPSRPYFVSEYNPSNNRSKTIAFTRTKEEAEEIARLSEYRSVVRRMMEGFDIFSAFCNA
jgi:hypothetical protein